MEKYADAEDWIEVDLQEWLGLSDEDMRDIYRRIDLSTQKHGKIIQRKGKIRRRTIRHKAGRIARRAAKEARHE